MIKRKYVKSKDIYKTTFRIPKDVAGEANSAVIVGDFNEWNQEEPIEMNKLKSGDFKAVVELPEGEYEFKYILDKQDWKNDNEADNYVNDPYGGQNSVLILN